MFLFLSFQNKIVFILCVLVFYLCVHMCIACMPDAQEIRGTSSYIMWVLGTQLGSTRAVSALNSTAISPTPFFLLKYVCMSCVCLNVYMCVYVCLNVHIHECVCVCIWKHKVDVRCFF